MLPASMCRLFAVCATEPVKVHRAFAALRSQSHEHKDGWGVVTFDADPVHVTAQESAHLSDRFRDLGRSLESKAMLAHIRLASVGGVTPPNTHPFFEEGWAFQHNGTVRGFATRREQLEALLPADRRARLKGETDSERLFQLFLARRQGDAPRQVAAALASVIRDVAAIFDEPGAKPSSMNLMVCNGTLLVATRRGRELHHLRRPTAHLISSEPLWHDEPWEEVPEETAIAIDQALALTHWALKEL